jgi:hypothetical protein
MSSINKKLESDAAELLITKIKRLVEQKRRRFRSSSRELGARYIYTEGSWGEAPPHPLDKTKPTTTTIMITRRETKAHKQRFAHFSSATRISASSLRLSSSDLPVSHSVVGRRGEKMIATPTIQKTGKTRQKSGSYPAIYRRQQTYRSHRQTNNGRVLSARHQHQGMDKQCTLGASQTPLRLSRVEEYAVQELSFCVVCPRKIL